MVADEQGRDRQSGDADAASSRVKIIRIAHRLPAAPADEHPVDRRPRTGCWRRSPIRSKKPRSAGQSLRRTSGRGVHDISVSCRGPAPPIAVAQSRGGSEDLVEPGGLQHPAHASLTETRAQVALLLASPPAGLRPGWRCRESRYRSPWSKSTRTSRLFFRAIQQGAAHGSGLLPDRFRRQCDDDAGVACSR